MPDWMDRLLARAKSTRPAGRPSPRASSDAAKTAASKFWEQYWARWPRLPLDEPDWERFHRALSARRDRAQATDVLLHVALAQVLASPEGRTGLADFFTKAKPVEWLRVASATARLLTDAGTTAIYPPTYPEIAEALNFPGRIAAEEVRDPLSTGLASMSFDGYLRERAVRRLSALVDPLAAAFLVLRVVDNIPATAAEARTAVLELGRRDQTAFALAAPLVSALQRRERMTGFPDEFFSIASADVTRQRLMLSSPDSVTQQMGLDLALRSGSLGIDDLVQLAVRSGDTAVSIRAGKAVVDRATADDPRVLALLDGRPLLRRSVLDALPVSEDSAVIGRRLLFDRSPVVRAAAQGLMKRAGESPARLYREALDVDGKRSIAIWELGYLGTPDDLPGLRSALVDPDHRVRKAAVTAVARCARADSVPWLVPLLADAASGVAGEAGRQLLPYVQLLSGSILGETCRSPLAHTRAATFRLLRRRSSAERLEGDFLALADIDQAIRAKGQLDLSNWLDRGAATARRGTLETRRRLSDLLEPVVGTIDPKRLALILFHAGLRPQNLEDRDR